MNRVGRIAIGLVLTASFTVLGACSTSKVVGRVVPGAISHVGVVDGSDERLSRGGLGGIEVSILAPGGEDGVLGRAVSTADGSFAVRIDSANWPTDRVQVRATGDDYATARGTVYLPAGEKRLLILMERTAGD